MASEPQVANAPGSAAEYTNADPLIRCGERISTRTINPRARTYLMLHDMRRPGTETAAAVQPVGHGADHDIDLVALKEIVRL